MRLKFTSITLLFVLASPLLVPYCWLQYEKFVVKDEAENRIAEGIDEDELVLLKFSGEESLTEVRWEDPGEFEYKGQMFDIVDTRIEGDTIYYSCWWDKEETLILKQLAELSLIPCNSDPKDKEAKERLYSYFKTLCAPVNFNWSPINPWKNNPLNSIYLASSSSFLSKPPSPPPRVS